MRTACGAASLAALLACSGIPANGAESWTVFSSNDTAHYYLGIATGADGAMWLTDFESGLVRVDAAGRRRPVPLAYRSGGVQHRFLPAAIARGVDDKFYLTGCVDVDSNCAFVGVAAASGSIVVYPTPSGESPRYNGIAAGPGGDVWFAEPGHIAKISPAGRIVEYRYPSGEATNMLSGVAQGADGHVWFTEVDEIAAGNIDPATGKIVEYKLKPQKIDCGVSGMTSARDGKLYFGCGTGIVAMSTAGAARYFSTGYQLSDSPLDVARGPDGNAWAAALTSVQQVVGRRSEVVSYVPPGSPLTMYASATGADGRLWTLCEDGTVYVLTPPATERRSDAP